MPLPSLSYRKFLFGSSRPGGELAPSGRLLQIQTASSTQNAESAPILRVSDMPAGDGRQGIGLRNLLWPRCVAACATRNRQAIASFLDFAQYTLRNRRGCSHVTFPSLRFLPLGGVERAYLRQPRCLLKSPLSPLKSP
jgi:hypothetical protein